MTNTSVPQVLELERLTEASRVGAGRTKTPRLGLVIVLREHSPASFTTSLQATVGLGLELVGVSGGWSVLYKSLAFLLS